MSVGEFCNREVIVTQRESAIDEAARLMREYHVGDLVVVESIDAPVPIGLVTDRDIVIEVVAKGVAPGAVTVGDVMSFEVATAREDEGLWESLQRMRLRGVRRLPIVDGHNRLVGIIAADDILELLAEELSALARVANRERTREQQRRP